MHFNNRLPCLLDRNLVIIVILDIKVQLPPFPFKAWK